MNRNPSIKSFFHRVGCYFLHALTYLLFCLPVLIRADSLESLNWMLGEWSEQKTDERIEERWEKVDPSVFKGKGRKISTKTDTLLFSESLLLSEIEGEIFYIAKVKENAMPVSFKLVQNSSGSARFENLEHDFPKRIEYRLLDRDRLEVNVSDMGKTGFTLHFQRITTEQKNP